MLFPQLYTSCRAHRKCSCHLSPHTAGTIPCTRLPVLCLSSPWTYSFQNRKPVPPTPLSPTYPSPHCLSFGNHTVCFLCSWVGPLYLNGLWRLHGQGLRLDADQSPQRTANNDTRTPVRQVQGNELGQEREGAWKQTFPYVNSR